MVTPAELLAPKGRVVGSSMFPGESPTDLEARMKGYLDEGVEKAGATVSDAIKLSDAATAWAYHRAFEAVFIRMSSSPSTATVQGDGSVSYTSAQIQGMKDTSDSYLAAYVEIVTPIVGGVILSAPITTSVANKFSF